MIQKIAINRPAHVSHSGLGNFGEPFSNSCKWLHGCMGFRFQVFGMLLDIEGFKDSMNIVCVLYGLYRDYSRILPVPDKDYTGNLCNNFHMGVALKPLEMQFLKGGS